MSRILDKLTQRAKDRPGELKKFPIKFKDKVAVDELVYIQPVFANEFDMATSKASIYVESLKTKDAVVLEEAIAVELITQAYRDADNHEERIFSNAGDVRNNCTKEEIALLITLSNLVTWRLAPQEIVDNRETALHYAQELSAKGDTTVIELLNADELMRLCLELAKEVQRLTPNSEPDKKA